MYHHQQRCVDIICNQKSHITYKHIFAQHVSLFPLPIFSLCGDTPFYAFGYEIEDFYLTRKKTGRRYVRRVYVYTYIMPI